MSKRNNYMTVLLTKTGNADPPAPQAPVYSEPEAQRMSLDDEAVFLRLMAQRGFATALFVAERYIEEGGDKAVASTFAAGEAIDVGIILGRALYQLDPQIRFAAQQTLKYMLAEQKGEETEPQ